MVRGTCRSYRPSDTENMYNSWYRCLSLPACMAVDRFLRTNSDAKRMLAAILHPARGVDQPLTDAEDAFLMRLICENETVL